MVKQALADKAISNPSPEHQQKKSKWMQFRSCRDPTVLHKMKQQCYYCFWFVIIVIVKMVSAHQGHSPGWESVLITPAKSNGRWHAICFRIQNSRKTITLMRMTRKITSLERICRLMKTRASKSMLVATAAGCSAVLVSIQTNSNSVVIELVKFGGDFPKHVCSNVSLMSSNGSDSNIMFKHK